MEYSEFAIASLKEKLLTLSLQSGAPKKYAGPLFEAFEVIQQREREIVAMRTKLNEERK